MSPSHGNRRPRRAMILPTIRTLAPPCCALPSIGVGNDCHTRYRAMIQPTIRTLPPPGCALPTISFSFSVGNGCHTRYRAMILLTIRTLAPPCCALPTISFSVGNGFHTRCAICGGALALTPLPLLASP
ncbi:hypothetical protein [Aeromonas bivalvium]|uniref:hypothetical protein n=1 Tax=Aeromonas bivalvium TaxID=440079 RepID=UPI0038D10648